MKPALCLALIGAMPVLLSTPGCTADQSGAFSAFFARLFGPAKPPVIADIHYILGAGYPAGGIWYYPRESFSYEMTGLAQVMREPHAPLTTDGEIYDVNAMAGAHQTLQLPAIVRVTNLENGRQALLRLNDRGPAQPSRILAVTPVVAALLGFDPDGTARVRVQIEPGPSQSLAHQLNGAASRIDVQTAPVAAVEVAALPPLLGAKRSSIGSSGDVQSGAAIGATVRDPGEEPVPLHLPKTVVIGPASPGTLWIEAGSFGRAEYARRLPAPLSDTGAQVAIANAGGQTSYTVRIGPIDNVAAADSLMQQVIRDGVSDARVVVE